MQFAIQPVLEFGIPESLEILNLGFSDYLVPIRMDIPGFFDLTRTNDIDLNLSQVVLESGQAIGIGLIARRGWSSRLVAMAVVPEHRGKGAGQHLMKSIVEAAALRGDKRLELEVIEQNEPAVKLYRKLGFRTVRRLLSYRIENPSGQKMKLIEIDIRELAELVNHFGIPHLPWQLSGENLSGLGLPNRAFRQASSFVAISDPDDEAIIFRSLLTMPNFRLRGQASGMLRALFAQYPGKTWIVPAIYPEEMDGFFESRGFERQKLSQFQMELLLHRLE